MNASASFPTDNDMILQRRRMIQDQIRARGVHRAEILEIMMEIPRERFVPPQSRSAAYEDRALEIGNGQTISQPFIVAFMTDRLWPLDGQTVLEIGTGSGYQIAILARLAKHVYSVERIESLRTEATRRLQSLKIDNVSLVTGDGSLGLAEHAPFDRIIVTAASRTVPDALKTQLQDGGILIAPIGGAKEQTLVQVVREGDEFREIQLLACRFVKLIGEQGWLPGSD